MRLLALAGAFGLALVATGPLATQADAHPSATRFCAQYKGGAENCGFYSFNQCLAALSGIGGICTLRRPVPRRRHPRAYPARHVSRSATRTERARTAPNKKPGIAAGLFVFVSSGATAPAGSPRAASCRPAPA